MCVYVCVCMCVCTCVHVCVCVVHVHESIHVHVCVCTHTCIAEEHSMYQICSDDIAGPHTSFSMASRDIRLIC